MILTAPGKQQSVSLNGLGDCLPLGYDLGGQPMCRDNNTGSVVACTSAGCSRPSTTIVPTTPYEQYGTDCTPRQYTFLDPAPWPPKDPCIIKNTVPCLPADWPRRRSGYYDGDPGVPDCPSVLSPFGTPITPTGNTLNNVAPPPASPVTPPAPGNVLTPPAGTPVVPRSTVNNGTTTGNPVLGTRPGDEPAAPNEVTDWIKANWVLLAAGAGALLLLPTLMSSMGRR